MFTTPHLPQKLFWASFLMPVRITTVFFFLTLFANPAFADCGCDYTVPGGAYLIDGKSLNIKPGNTICLKAGVNYGVLKFANIVGTASAPITIKNCGGKVTISQRASVSLRMAHSKHFRITGSGSSDKYGIVLRNATSLGISLGELSTNFEVDRVEVHTVGFAGIMAKTDPQCGKPYGRGSFTMYDIKIHDNYIHDTQGEGIYVGNSFYANGMSSSCGKLLPHAIKHAKIYNNHVVRTGWDGIQVGSAIEGCEVYGNLIESYGTKKNNTHGNGIQLGEGTGGKCYNNTIKNGPANGIIVLGKGDNVVFNNLIIKPGEHGSFIDARPPATTGPGFKFFNNTVINPGKDGVRIYATQSGLTNQVKNNLVIGGAKAVALKYDGVTNTQVSDNYRAGSASEARFVNVGGGDYRLSSSSPCVNQGADVTSYGVTFGMAGTSRPKGGALDQGAYEYNGSTTTTLTNKPPIVNAGSDRTITLPTNQVTINATASDTDGSIASYAWKKKSGPSATLSGTSSKSFTTSKLLEGIYVFSITVKDNKGALATDDVKVTVAKTASPAPSPTLSGDNGLNYSYYEGAWSVLPNFDGLKAKKQGVVSNFSLAPRSRSDYFGFKFEGYVDIKTSGRYTFYTSSDDGSALYIDGVRVVNNDGLHPVEERSGSKDLSQGKHAIKVVFFEKTIGEKLTVQYAGPGLSKRVIPDNVLFKGNSTSNSGGLNYSYYEGAWSVLPNFDGLKAKKQGVVSNFSLAPRSRSDYFGFKFEGYIDIKTSGRYTFYTSSDDGSALYIDGVRVVNNDGLHPVEERSGSKDLSQGKHAIKVIFFEKTIGEKLTVQYAGPGLSKRVIPDNVLSRTSNNSRTEGNSDANKGDIAQEPSTLDELLGGLDVSVYPNPVRDRATVRIEGGSDESLNLKVVDAMGRLLHSNRTVSNRTELDIYTYVKQVGIFYLVIEGNQGYRKTIKMIKE